ncbi:MAG: carboxypeptidase-like regulatory domain-containing protein [Flavobacteriaceae bacterium]|nr:carboxypeptidase-like regulatory domain-containing protein [Flavobacteriaceae bacterium]
MLKKLYYLYILFVCITTNSSAQKYTTKNIIVDSNTQKPISNVNIFNKIDNTITNDDGKFIFNSTIDSIEISHLGFEKLITNFGDLRKRDTVLLKQHVIPLNEVDVTSKEAYIQTVYNRVNDNFPYFEYGEKVFLRCIVKKNNEIIKFQDILLDVGRNSIFTSPNFKNIVYDIKILNLRKAGIISKSKIEEDFGLLSFENLFKWYSAIFTNPKNYSYSEEMTTDLNYKKINFRRKVSSSMDKGIEGYYIINNNDLSFYKVHYNTVFDNILDIPFNESKGIKWRTIGNELEVTFNKNIQQDKYFINNGKLKNVVEVINNDVRSTYEASYQILTTQSFVTQKINSNYSSTKDIFMVDFNYDKTFWFSQNQLLLNNELINFINSLNDKKKQYKIYSNFTE